MSTDLSVVKLGKDCGRRVLLTCSEAHTSRVAALLTRCVGFVLGVVALGTLTLSSLQAQVPAQQPAPSAPEVRAAPPVESDRKTSTPYSGDLSIFEGKDRAEKLQIERVMDLLEISAGKTVADIGAGSGWFSVLAAGRVGATGSVVAVDISQASVDHIARRSVEENIPQLTARLGAPDDPLLAPSSVDAVLILKTYHEFERPVTMMDHLRRAVRPGGLVGVIDKNGHGDDHGISPETVIDECRRAGFELVSQHDFVKGDGVDYFLIFRPVAR